MSVDRGFTWMDDETVALIDIFSKPNVQEELRGAKRNITVYEKVAQELSDIGFTRTAYQCREKIKRLRKEYQHVKHCISLNTKPRKPMKYFELVSKIFDCNFPESNVADSNLHHTEMDEELYPFKESDASNSIIDSEHVSSQSLLPESSFSELDEDNSHMLLEVKLTNSTLTQINDEDNLFLNDAEQNYNFHEKDTSLEGIESPSPWVPNVVLEENVNKDSESKSDNTEEDESKIHNASDNEYFKESHDPPRKRRKYSALERVMEKVTENFLKYQTDAESRFLDRITQIERERMKRDESMQKIWLEFEERRRKEEQEHELKMLSLLGQFVKQMNGNNSDSKIT